MQPHEVRLLDEKVTLDERCLKLRHFLAVPAFLELDPVDQGLLRVQLATMQAYAVILEMRVDRIPDGSSK